MERPGTRASLATVGVGVVTRRSWIALATGAALVLVPGPKANAAPRAGIAFDDRAPGRLVLTAPGYTLTLAKRNGRILGLVDRAAGRSLVGTASRCLWGALAQSETSYVGGCYSARTGIFFGLTRSDLGMSTRRTPPKPMAFRFLASRSTRSGG